MSLLTGHKYETLAQQYLDKHGLKLVSKNFRSRMGEIDLIMQDEQTLIFVEVKYRSKANYGETVEMIPPSKQHKLIKTAEYFCHKHPKWYAWDQRFDMIAISQSQNNTGHQFEWLENIIIQ